MAVTLDSEVLQLAEPEARARHTTLPEIAAPPLRVMARNWQDSRAAVTEELQQQHGIQG